MYDGANELEAVPVRAEEGRRSRWPAVLLLGIGGGVGLVLGVLLTVGVTATYILLTPTLLPTQDLVQVFDELNDLRQQINRGNEERKLRDQETVASIRQALSDVASAARPGQSGAPAKAEGRAMSPPPAAARGPFAELDEEIKRLEDTQKVLNTILDMFTPKERPRDPQGTTDSPK